MILSLIILNTLYIIQYTIIDGTSFIHTLLILGKVQPGKQSAKLESTKKEEAGRSDSRTVPDSEETGKYISIADVAAEYYYNNYCSNYCRP